MNIDFVGADAEKLLDWHELIAAIEAGHLLPKAAISDLILRRASDTLLDRAAWIDGLGSLVKVATVMPGNSALGLPAVNGAVALFDDRTGVLSSMVDFHLVTKWKTAGDSLLSASKLARKDSQNILLVGAGTVARSMVQAYSALFPKANFTVWSRNLNSAAEMGFPVAENLQRAIKQADIICTATMATEPLINGAWLQPGQHLDLIGAYRPDMREVDDLAMSRARLFVDSRATTIHHIGELMLPLKSGAIKETDVMADFYDIKTGSFTRQSDDEITIAKNGGGAHLDLMTANYVIECVRGRKG